MSTSNNIITFSILNIPGSISGNIITLTVPYGTNLTSLIPTITITGTSVNPASEVAHNFSTPQTYTVTSTDLSTQDYLVTVSIEDPKNIIRNIVDINNDSLNKLNASISTANTQIAVLQGRVGAIIDSMMTVAANSLLHYLEYTKYPKPNYFVQEGPNFNQALQVLPTPGNITDWKVYKDSFDNLDPSLPDWTYVSSTRFTVLGNQTSLFPSLVKIVFAIHDGTSCVSVNFCDISSSSFGGGLTTVNIVQPVLVFSDHGLIATYYTTYLSGDPTIDDYINQWNFSYNYLHQSVGPSGTYGLLDTILKLQSSLVMTISNRDKCQDSINILGPYAGT